MNNKKLILAMLREMNPLDMAVFRDRLVQMAAETRARIMEDPRRFDTPAYHHGQHLRVCDIIENTFIIK